MNQYNELGVRTGYWEVTHAESDIIWYKGVFKDGHEEGEWKYYFNDGNLYCKGKYLNGTDVGCWEYFNNVGTIREKEFHL